MLVSSDIPFFDPNFQSCSHPRSQKNQECSVFRWDKILAEQRQAIRIAAFLMQGDRHRLEVARCGYWLVIVVGTVLLFGREQEFHILKILFGIGLPRCFHLGMLQLLPADAQGGRVNVSLRPSTGESSLASPLAKIHAVLWVAVVLIGSVDGYVLVPFGLAALPWRRFFSPRL